MITLVGRDGWISNSLVAPNFGETRVCIGGPLCVHGTGLISLCLSARFPNRRTIEEPLARVLELHLQFVSWIGTVGSSCFMSISTRRFAMSQAEDRKAALGHLSALCMPQQNVEIVYLILWDAQRRRTQLIMSWPSKGLHRKPMALACMARAATVSSGNAVKKMNFVALGFG
jgi:hypothetical protein